MTRSKTGRSLRGGLRLAAALLLAGCSCSVRAIACGAPPARIGTGLAATAGSGQAVLLYGALPVDLAGAGVAAKVAAIFRDRGFSADWLVAGGPGCTLSDAAADLAGYVASHRPRVVVCLFTQRSLLAEALRARASRYGILAKPALWLSTLWTFRSGANQSGLVEEVLGRVLREMNEMKDRALAAGSDIIFLTDGEIQQLPGEGWIGRAVGPRSMVGLELLPVFASRARLRFGSFPAIGMAIHSGPVSADRLSALLGAALSEEGLGGN